MNKYTKIITLFLLCIQIANGNPIPAELNERGILLFTNSIEVDEFIKKIDTIKYNTSEDDVISLLGKPETSDISEFSITYNIYKVSPEKIAEVLKDYNDNDKPSTNSTRKSLIKNWKDKGVEYIYNIHISLDNLNKNRAVRSIYLYQKLENGKGNKKIYDRSFNKQDIENLVTGLKSLRISEDTPEEVRKKTMDHWNRGKSLRGEYLHFVANDMGNVLGFTVQFDSLGKLAEISIMKGTDIIYHKTSGANTSNAPYISAVHITNLAVEPSSPTVGQIYFNSTDSHFYGYNGKEWIQLDNPKN
jgi:hypothetical protein